MKTYKTKDISISAMLLTKKIPLIAVNKSNNTVFFEFDQKDKCEELSKLYWFGDCPVNAKDFHQNLGVLKGQIFNN
jgi:hypothetical protein